MSRDSENSDINMGFRLFHFVNKLQVHQRALGSSQRPKYFPSLPLPKMSVSFVLLYVFPSNKNDD